MNAAPPDSPLCYLHSGHSGPMLAAGHEGVNGTRVSRAGLACGRVLAAPAVGKSEGRSSRPQQTHPCSLPACGVVCSARGMALKRGEAPPSAPAPRSGGSRLARGGPFWVGRWGKCPSWGPRMPQVPLSTSSLVPRPRTVVQGKGGSPLSTPREPPLGTAALPALWGLVPSTGDGACSDLTLSP